MVLTKQQLIETLQHEIRILVHLIGKVRPEMLEYRPTPKQRSLIDLLRYLTYMGPVLVASIKAGSFLMDEWSAAEAAANTMDFEAVAKALEAQSAHYVDAINALSDEELQTEIDIFGAKSPRGPMLVSTVVCGHAAYRTQLFCYLKSCGRDELNTYNLWVGIDGTM